MESIQLMMQEEEAKEKAFLEKLAQKLKDGGVSNTTSKVVQTGNESPISQQLIG